jgi:diguanylate cyclase (GGDEF)-like protein/PAS domain S-box-containing protein
MVKLFGYSSREELLAVDIKKDLYFAPEDRSSQFLDTEQEEVDVYHMRRKDGSEIWVEGHGYYVHNEKGDIQYHEGMLRDITARKLAEEELRESESQLRVLFEQMAVGVARIETPTGKFVQINQKYCDIVGYSRAEMESLDFQSITHPQDLQADLGNMERLKSGEIQNFTMEKRYVHKNGSIVWVTLTVSPMWQAGAMPDFHIAIVQDITARKLAEENSLLQSAALEAAANAIAITDKKGVIQWVNLAWVTLTGYSKEESIGQNTRVLKSKKHDVPFYKNMWETILAGKVWRGELVNRRKDGSLYSEEETITPVLDKQGNVKNFIAIKLDITMRKQREEELRLAREELEMVNLELRFAFEHEQHLAHTDMLTGVNNRRYLFELAEHEFDVARRYGQPLSIIMFDLDHFKLINDTFGHALGDQMLQLVTQVTCSQLRDVDLIGRYGGEEFVIVLPVTSAVQAYLLAERIRSGVTALRVENDKGAATVTLSIGIAEMIHEPQDKSVEDVIHRADEAMYAAKQAGRNRTVIFDAE